MRSRPLVVRTSRSRLEDGRFKSNLGDLVRASILTRCLPEDARWLTDRNGERLLGCFIDPARIYVLEDLGEALRLEPGTHVYQLDDHTTAAERVRGERLVWTGFLPEAGGSVRPANDRIAGILPYRAGVVGAISWQQSLIEGAGFSWRQQDYPEARVPHTRRFDVGLNHRVHAEWTSKQWAPDNWRALARALARSRTVDWQQGEADLDAYIRWLASCRLVVTGDSLGLHLASALRCKVVALTGPTESREFDYDRLRHVQPGARVCQPCQAPVCGAGLSTCLDEISPRRVCAAVNDVLGASATTACSTTQA